MSMTKDGCWRGVPDDLDREIEAGFEKVASGDRDAAGPTGVVPEIAATFLKRARAESKDECGGPDKKAHRR